MAIRHRPKCLFWGSRFSARRLDASDSTANITDDSNLAVARLLRDLVEPIGRKGGLLDGEEIAAAIQDEGVKVGYGVTQGETGTILGK